MKGRPVPVAISPHNEYDPSVGIAANGSYVVSYTYDFSSTDQDIHAKMCGQDPDVVKICLDTGHAVVGGGDPVELARTARNRIAHVHLKDVDPRVLERVRAQELSVEEAWEQGLFCPFGEGAVDFAGVLSELEGYEGWAVVEQDRVAVRVDDLATIRDVEVANLAVLRRAIA